MVLGRGTHFREAVARACWSTALPQRAVHRGRFNVSGLNPPPHRGDRQVAGNAGRLPQDFPFPPVEGDHDGRGRSRGHCFRRADGHFGSRQKRRRARPSRRRLYAEPRQLDPRAPAPRTTPVNPNAPTRNRPSKHPPEIPPSTRSMQRSCLRAWIRGCAWHGAETAGESPARKEHRQSQS